MLEKVDKLVIGGGMIFTFLKVTRSITFALHKARRNCTFLQARGLNVGSSLVEMDKIDLAKELEAIAAKKGVEIILPTDVVIADKFAEDANTNVVGVDAIPDGWMGLDIGPKSIELISNSLRDCKTVIWNGPMGVFEFEKFAKVQTQAVHMSACKRMFMCTNIYYQCGITQYVL
jgi:phosphoglycerate kinase